MLKTFLVLFCLFFSVLSFTQDLKNSKEWGEPISWHDFKGKPPRAIPYSARTNLGISMDFSWKVRNNKVELDYLVKTLFNSCHSWVKKGKESSKLLQHEQTHFDITELIARRFRKYLNENSFKPGNVRKELDKRIFRVHQTEKELQENYDRETLHGRDEEKQREWTEKILQELDLLREYSYPGNFYREEA